jgi:hypothetical protein
LSRGCILSDIYSSLIIHLKQIHYCNNQVKSLTWESRLIFSVKYFFMKKNMIAVFALLIGLVCFAFVPGKKEEVKNPEWAFFSLEGIDPENAEHYMYLGSTDTEGCNGEEEVVCTIFAEVDGDKPILHAGNPENNISAYSTTFRE